jgi:hypothetical protein
MKKIVLLASALAFAGTCFWLSNLRPAHAAGGTDTWTVGPNCVGVTNTAQHVCEFAHTQLHVGADPTPYDQWDLIVIEPGIVTSVSCQIMGPNSMPYTAGFGGSKVNPWAGAHYSNVGICRGWINGGNGPIKVTATYQ